MGEPVTPSHLLQAWTARKKSRLERQLDKAVRQSAERVAERVQALRLAAERER